MLAAFVTAVWVPSPERRCAAITVRDFDRAGQEARCYP